MLLLRGGRVIDPGTSLDGVADVLVEGRSVVAVGRDVPVTDADVVLDVSGLLVGPGFIGVHSHTHSIASGGNRNPPTPTARQADGRVEVDASGQLPGPTATPRARFDATDRTIARRLPRQRPDGEHPRGVAADRRARPGRPPIRVDRRRAAAGPLHRWYVSVDEAVTETAASAALGLHAADTEAAGID